MKPSFYLWAILALGIYASGAQALAAQDSTRSQWATTGSLSTARAGHTSTLLPDGRVLIAGGYGGAGELASCELYQPDKGQFVPTGDLGSGRVSHTATLLPNGQVLVVGGQIHGTTLASAELYNPATGVWTPTGSLHVPRSYHTATLLPDGHVLVVGGSQQAPPTLYPQGTPAGSALDVVEVYDPRSGKWTITGSLHLARYVHTATLLRYGMVLVTGGIGADGRNNVLGSAELYNPGTKTWTATGSLGNARFFHTANLLPNGSVLVAGGHPSAEDDLASAELYNPSTGTWAPTGSLLEEVNAQSATSLSNGQVLVVGGAAKVPDGGDLNAEGMTASAELYNPSTQTWNKVADLTLARNMQGATLLPDGQVLISGGEHELGSPDHTIPNAELFSFSTDSALVNLPFPGSDDLNHSMVLLNKIAPPVLTLATCLVVITICLVIMTPCIVVLLIAALIFILVSRSRK